MTIRYLTVTGFAAPLNEGVVNHDSGDGWVIEHSTIRNNDGAGMMAGARQQVRFTCLADNGQYGFNAYQGGDGITDLVFEHNEIRGNNTGDWERKQKGCGCTGGGKFWSVQGATHREQLGARQPARSACGPTRTTSTSSSSATSWRTTTAWASGTRSATTPASPTT